MRRGYSRGRPYGHSFHGKLTNGIMWDSNPKASTNNLFIDSIIGDLTLDPAYRPRSDWADVVQAELYYAYRFKNSPISFKTNAFFYAPTYFNQHDQTYQYVSLRSGFSYENDRFAIDLLGRFNFLEKNKRADLRAWGYEAVLRYLATDSLLLVGSWRHDIKNRFEFWCQNFY